MNCQFDIANKIISVRVPYALEKQLGEYLKIPVNFPYKERELVRALTEEKKVYVPRSKKHEMRTSAVSYRFIQKQPGVFYIQASFEELPGEVNTLRSQGVLGLDLNVDHIAVCETDKHGNPIKAFSLPFDPYGVTSDQRTAQFGDHIASIVDYAKTRGKTIVCEKLDFQKKRIALREKYGRKLCNLLSQFAYKKFFEMLHLRAGRHQVNVHPVSAAFTSIIGYFKFRGYKKLSSHEQAALAIARRGMGYSERPKTKNAPFGTVSIQDVCDDIPAFVKESRMGHVWSFYSRCRTPIREHMLKYSTSSPGRLRDFVYNPRYSTGYFLSRRYLFDAGRTRTAS